MPISTKTTKPPQLLTPRQYKELLADLRQIIGAGKQEAERAAAQALLESYWSIGQRISKEKLTTRAAFHNAILTDLSADLAIDLRTLQRTVTFYRTRKYDIHRRYFAHVFYAFNKRGIESTFLKGRYLNQELIDKGHAKPV